MPVCSTLARGIAPPARAEHVTGKLGFVDDAAVWLLMLKKRNTSVHIYNEQEVDEMILLIRDSFIPAFVGLEKTLRSKLEEVKNDWE